MRISIWDLYTIQFTKEIQWKSNGKTLNGDKKTHHLPKAKSLGYDKYDPKQCPRHQNRPQRRPPLLGLEILLVLEIWYMYTCPYTSSNGRRLSRLLCYQYNTLCNWVWTIFTNSRRTDQSSSSKCPPTTFFRIAPRVFGVRECFWAF